MNRRWMAGLLALTGLVPTVAGAVAPSGEPVAEKFSFPVGTVPNSPTTSRSIGLNGRVFLGWTVHPAAAFLSPAYGRELQPGEDWISRGGPAATLGQPVYAAAAGTILAAGYYGPQWNHIVLIKHTLPGGQVVLTQYANMQSIAKRSGTVEWREVIGQIGPGPRGAALHFEVRQASMLEAPPDYWPSHDGKDADWVRQNYLSPTLFIRTHFQIFTPAPAPAPPPGEPGSPGTDPGPAPNPGTEPAPGTPGTEPAPGTPGTEPIPGLPGPVVPPPVQPAWDGVPHLDGSLLKSASGAYYLLHGNKKWPIASEEVLATWARPAEALPATDAELASYPDSSHPLGLRWGSLFQGSSGPVCISSDPLDDPGLACWVIDTNQTFVSLGFSRLAVRSVSPQTMSLYIRPTPFGRNSPLPPGMLLKKPYGGLYVMDRLFGYIPAVRPVTSVLALRSWQMDEAMAAEINDFDFWDRIGRMDSPLRFRSGAILQSSTGQLWIVSGEYRHAVPSMELFERRGYSRANIIPVSDAELALHRETPTPLQ